ncbi:hypothetical protein BS47DRAFT_1484065 [Hydnum rufescens UP504]|uniref:Uncharacterized protein n=1 Tax=Hydnum rufescens UP504 TaxID=1448309 RepID=A0A9P6B2B6_9AGAM|nr:hypothetical protein BS47DRAFT_1484065 [Hydnum rufescens UP504]
MSLSRGSTEVSKSNKDHPLWTLLGPSKDVGTLTTMDLNPAASLPPISINSRDKTSTSLRLLLCDTQHTMEGFSSQITTLTKDLGDAKRQIEEAGKIVEDGHIKMAEDVRLLLSRMQVSVTKSLDLVNTSLSSLIEKSDTQQAAFLSRQDSLQNQIMTLVQRLGIEHETKRLHDIEQKRWNEKHELDFGALVETLANQQTVISGQASSIVSLRESVDSLKEDISILSKTMANPVMGTGSRFSVPDSRPEASTMIQPDLLERPTTNVPEIILHEELITRNSSNVSGPPSDTSAPPGTFLTRLINPRRTTYPKLPDQRGFDVMFPPQVHPQQYRSLSRTSAHRLHSSPRDNFRPPSSSSPLAVLSFPLNKSSSQNHATTHALSVTPQSLKRPFSATPVPVHSAASGSPLFSKGCSVSLPRMFSSSISRPRQSIPLRAMSGKSDDNSGGAPLESEIQLVEHTKKKIKVNLFGNSRTILQDEGPRGAWNVETQTKDLWMT